MKNNLNQARVNNVNTGRYPLSDTADRATTRNSFHRNYPTSNLKKGTERIPVKTLSTNAQGLYSKFALLSATIEEDDPDIITITETWLDSTITDAEFTPRGYTCFRKDRNPSDYSENTYSNLRRGGVLLLVKQNLNPTHYEKGDTDAEIIWVSLALQPKFEWLVGVCCRPESWRTNNAGKDM